MAKVIKAKVAPVIPVADAKPVDRAAAIKAASDTAIAVFLEHSTAFDVYTKIGERLTAAIMAIFKLTVEGRERELAMRPLLDAVAEKRGTDEKGAKKYLSNYVTNARKAIDIEGKGEALASVSIKSVNAAEKKSDKPKAKGKGGQGPGTALDKVMNYNRPHIATLAETPAATGGHSQLVELLLWQAHEAKAEAVYSAQHGTVVITFKK
jgi:hypothetical protein